MAAFLNQLALSFDLPILDWLPGYDPMIYRLSWALPSTC